MIGVDPDVAEIPAPALPPGRPLLVVTGFMGTGKTEAGRRAADLLAMPFVDLDRVIERRAGAPIAKIFRQAGEGSFRELERQAVEEAARLSGAVVATGGGAVLDRESFGHLSEGAVTAVLTCRPEVLQRRLHRGWNRPLLQPDPATEIRRLMAEREEAYLAAGAALDTTDLPPADAARQLADRYRTAAAIGDSPAEIVRIAVTGPDGPYPAIVGHGLLARLGHDVAAALPQTGSAVVVADEAVQGPAGQAAQSLREAGVEAGSPILLPPGEQAKSIDTVDRLWTEFRSRELDPSTVVVAVGGGAALDVAGFAAATYARGLPLVNAPTTLLAMVDAGVGGKVGIDHAGAKNLVGTFHHPRAVVADLATLRSLPRRTLLSGLAECVKAAVLASPLMIDVLSDVLPSPQRVPEPSGALAWIVEQSVRIKAGYVALDPLDRGARHALNLGHTFAHAVEAATGYSIAHGEAVAIGLLAACRLGTAAGITPPRLESRLSALLHRLGLPTQPPPGLSAGALMEAMTADKKRRSGRSAFVVPAAAGAALLRGVEPDAAIEALIGAGR
jgi:shikimate kinase / 3-dehydroquinate synthase